MTIRVVLQARMTSSRLPGKVLLPVAGMPIVILAARRAGAGTADVVIATSQEVDDDPLAAEAIRWGIPAIRGDLEDTLNRFVLAATGMDDDDVVVRLTADNVLPDAKIIELVARSVSPAAPYARLGGTDSPLPYGVSVEAMSARILRQAAAVASTPHDREHVTPWIRRTAPEVVISPPASPAWRGLRSTVDTLDDYARVASLFAGIDDPVRVPWQMLADRLAAMPASDQTVRRRPTLTLGTAQLGARYGAANSLGMPTPETAVTILRTARDSGFGAVDTARAYGLSEARVGDAFRRGLREHMQIVTKVRPLDDLPANADPRWGSACVDASFAQSQCALSGVPIHALLTHRASDWLKPGVRPRMVALRDDGAVARIGVSLSTPRELLAALADSEVGYVQVPFNLADGRWLTTEVQTAVAGRPDVVVAARSAFLQGLLLDVPGQRWPAGTGVDQHRFTTVLRSLVTRLSRASSTDVALAYVRAQTWISTIVLGAESPSQIIELGKLGTLPALSEDEARIVREEMGTVPLSLLDPSLWRLS